MRCQYVVQPGDTFENIAMQFYNNSHLAEKLRHYNGLYSPDFIIVGQPIVIPASETLHAASAAADTFPAGMQQPQGLEQLLGIFGNIYEYVDENGCFDESSWRADMLSTVQVPFPVGLSWDYTRRVRSVRCHKKIAGIIGDAFHAVKREGFEGEIVTLGDFYNFRSKRTCGKLSTHCWGISFDLNPEVNIPGTKGCISDKLVHLLQEFGFTWGGHLKGAYKDPMHFQFCTGY